MLDTSELTCLRHHHPSPSIQYVAADGVLQPGTHVRALLRVADFVLDSCCFFVVVVVFKFPV